MNGIRVAKHDPNRTDEHAALTRRPIVARADLYTHDIGTVIETIRADGITSLNGLPTQLNEQSIRTPRSKVCEATSVRNLL